MAMRVCKECGSEGGYTPFELKKCSHCGNYLCYEDFGGHECAEDAIKAKACIECGSQNLDAIPGGAYVGLTASGVFFSGCELCEDCGHFGVPIIFKKDEDYRDFLEHLENSEKPISGKN
ncbi:MAG: hypothetical protein V3R93_03765 [Candidatus Hydrothermarchaeaceae archaeon]